MRKRYGQSRYHRFRFVLNSRHPFSTHLLEGAKLARSVPWSSFTARSKRNVHREFDCFSYSKATDFHLRTSMNDGRDTDTTPFGSYAWHESTHARHAQRKVMRGRLVGGRVVNLVSGAHEIKKFHSQNHSRWGLGSCVRSGSFFVFVSFFGGVFCAKLISVGHPLYRTFPSRLHCPPFATRNQHEVCCFLLACVWTLG